MRFPKRLAGLKLAVLPVFAQNIVDLSIIHPQDRIRSSITGRTIRRLAGSVHPLARSENDTGRAPLTQVLHGMILVLPKDAIQQAARDQLTAAQLDPQSRQFHQWLTPQTYGEHFGVSSNDQQQIIQWLQSRGFIVDDTAPSRWTIIVSGTVSQVEQAFHTEIHLYRASSTGTVHYANTSAPELPEAFSEVVTGVIGLNNFPPHRSNSEKPQNLSSDGLHIYLAPSDFATIYNLNPLYIQGITGAGQTIGIVGRCEIDPNVVATFRQQFGLSANPVEYLWVKDYPPAPCNSTSNSPIEAYLDIEWSGAVAPGAHILYIAGTQISDSANTLVNYSRPDLMSTSYGSCEAQNDNNFWSTLWQQASAQGTSITVL